MSSKVTSHIVKYNFHFEGFIFIYCLYKSRASGMKKKIPGNLDFPVLMLQTHTHTHSFMETEISVSPVSFSKICTVSFIKKTYWWVSARYVSKRMTMCLQSLNSSSQHCGFVQPPVDLTSRARIRPLTLGPKDTVTLAVQSCKSSSYTYTHTHTHTSQSNH